MDVRSRLLDIAMNLNRVGNWAADDYSAKQKRIITFLDQTSEYVKIINQPIKNSLLNRTFTSFLTEFKTLEKEGREGPHNELDWAEKMMTWGNILTHRSSLLQKNL